MSNYWVYIVENAAGRFYIGHTDDLARRLKEPNDRQSAKIGEICG